MDNTIQKSFDEISKNYDVQRRKLIPCFDDFYNIAVSIGEAKSDSPNILDIGAGTGLFSSLIVKKYPKARLTLIDLSEKMLEVAKGRFQDNPNVQYVISDYTKYSFEDSYDLIISALSIHHLTAEEKRELYQSCFQALKPQGIFINADQVLGRTSFLDSLYKKDWQAKVEASGLSREEIEGSYERTKLDKMSTLDEQLSWLRESGFNNVDCVYKYFNFVVLYGQKDMIKDQKEF